MYRYMHEELKTCTFLQHTLKQYCESAIQIFINYKNKTTTKIFQLKIDNQYINICNIYHIDYHTVSFVMCNSFVASKLSDFQF